MNGEMLVQEMQVALLGLQTINVKLDNALISLERGKMALEKAISGSHLRSTMTMLREDILLRSVIEKAMNVR